MFGYGNRSNENTPVKSVMACIVAIKIAPHLSDNLIPFLQCINDLNDLLLKYEEIKDSNNNEKQQIREHIRNIGESLDEIGGHELMVLTCTYLTPNYNLSNLTEKIWAGIGGHWYP